VSAFTSANIDKILALKPDLVPTFSDLQADVAADLIRGGLDVHAFNRRSVAGILDMIRMVGAMVGASERADQLVRGLENRLAEATKQIERLNRRPSVFFEEWDDPSISGRMGFGARRDYRRHRHLRRSPKSGLSQEPHCDC
jgi:iron complex transport system substrate-binding protein